MIEVKNVEVFGLNRGINAISNSFTVGKIDTRKKSSERQFKVAQSLGRNSESHQSHDAYLTGILVEFDMKYNSVFMPEFQRYHFAQIIMSQSTMHSLKKFMDGDFDPYSKYVLPETKEIVKRLYTKWNDSGTYEDFEILRHNLPAGFEMWCTVATNYLQLKTICIQRKNHKNREDWNSFIKACFKMPMFIDLTGINVKEYKGIVI